MPTEPHLFLQTIYCNFIGTYLLAYPFKFDPTRAHRHLDSNQESAPSKEPPLPIRLQRQIFTAYPWLSFLPASARSRFTGETWRKYRREPPGGLEPPTIALQVRRSVQLRATATYLQYHLDSRVSNNALRLLYFFYKFVRLVVRNFFPSCKMAFIEPVFLTS